MPVRLKLKPGLEQLRSSARATRETGDLAMVIKINWWALALAVLVGTVPWAASGAHAQTAVDPAAASAGDWGVRGTLEGKRFSGPVNGGVGIVRFAKGAGNTVTMSFGMIGMKPSTVSFS